MSAPARAAACAGLVCAAACSREEHDTPLDWRTAGTPEDGDGDDTAPPPQGTVVLQNDAGQDFSRWWVCDTQGCAMTVFTTPLAPGASSELALPAGRYWSDVLAVDGACAGSPAFDLDAGGTYEWEVRELPGYWDEEADGCSIGR